MMIKAKVTAFIVICFLIANISCPICAFEAIQTPQKQQYPDLSYFEDHNNYPMKVSEILSKRREIYSNVVEPEDNGKGYVEYPEGAIDKLITTAKLYPSIFDSSVISHHFGETYSSPAPGKTIINKDPIINHSYDFNIIFKGGFVGGERIKSDFSYESFQKIQKQKLKILDPPEYYKTMPTERYLRIYITSRDEKTSYRLSIVFVGNKYMRVTYDDNVYVADFLVNVYTYIYPAYVELIEPYLDKYELFQEYKESIVYMDLENAI